jgi:hypothetical protein
MRAVECSDQDAVTIPVLAAYLMQPPVLSNFNLSPASLGAVPNVAMVVYAAAYSAALLLFAMRAFSRRDL